jgi:hypothetical protein
MFIFFFEHFVLKYFKYIFFPCSERLHFKLIENKCQKYFVCVMFWKVDMMIVFLNQIIRFPEFIVFVISSITFFCCLQIHKFLNIFK